MFWFLLILNSNDWLKNNFRPEFKTEEEVSVYDLRDHPDFRYRPGSVVIRVANFENGQTCSTGQVLDNFPSGEVNIFFIIILIVKS